MPRHPAQPVLHPARLRHGILAADAKIIQVDINPDRIGLTKKVTSVSSGDAAKVAKGILASCRDTAGDAGRAERKERIAQNQIGMGAGTDLDDTRTDDPGTTGTSAPARQTGLDEPPHGMARDSVGAAARGDHLL